MRKWGMEAEIIKRFTPYVGNLEQKWIIFMVTIGRGAEEMVGKKLRTQVSLGSRYKYWIE